jgi:hypothetical protein
MAFQRERKRQPGRRDNVVVTNTTPLNRLSPAGEERLRAAWETAKDDDLKVTRFERLTGEPRPFGSMANLYSAADALGLDWNRRWILVD